MVGLVGKKLGMTRIYTKDGISLPVTLIQFEMNYITQIKKLEKEGYRAIQVTTGKKKLNKISKPEIGHFAHSGIIVGRGLWEFKLSVADPIFSIGEILTVEIFTNIHKVDITGISKGKGFAGTVKRWNFKTQDATHGNSLSHRVPGSIGQNQTPGRVFKGKKMAGRLGYSKVTIQNLNLIRVDIKNNFLLVKGSVPGATGSDIIVKPAIKQLL
ncbi:MAG: 50S ribosomal protein L3 [Candidatus Dasytiphilus stammeri]